MAQWPTFDPALADDISWIRLQIGDTITDKGPRPIDEARNYQDETIQAILGQQGHRVACVAAIFETLAGEWQRFSISGNEGGFSVNAKEVAENYLALSNEWRRKPGGAGPDKPVSTGFFEIQRKDHYAA